jgi:hypothetical protein|eukprot:COSAG02_NODE_38_length_48090_cov_107.207060_29_plen_37_part_00
MADVVVALLWTTATYLSFICTGSLDVHSSYFGVLYR